MANADSEIQTSAGGVNAAPEIHLREWDYDVLANLALSMPPHRRDAARRILDEIDRAKLHPNTDLPPDVVAIGSEVEFVDERSGEVRKVALVLPGEADFDAGRVSVTTPIGVGLIGLREGHSIDWPCRDGRLRRLTVRAVSPPLAPPH